MAIHLTSNQIEIPYAIRAISNDFVVDDSGNLSAIFEGTPLRLVGISDELIESPWD